MKKPAKKGLTVTAVLHQDTGVITAFFDELPGLLVQGTSNNDVDGKLRSLLDSYLKRLDSIKNNISIHTTSMQ